MWQGIRGHTTKMVRITGILGDDTMRKYTFSSREIFRHKISVILVPPITFIFSFLLLIFLSTIPKAVFFDLFLALGVIVSIILSFTFFVMYIIFEPETPRFVKIGNEKIEVISPGRKTEYMIKDIVGIEYNHKRGYILIKLKNGKRKLEPYMRIIESQRKDFEIELQKMTEKVGDIQHPNIPALQENKKVKQYIFSSRRPFLYVAYVIVLIYGFLYSAFFLFLVTQKDMLYSLLFLSVFIPVLCSIILLMFYIAIEPETPRFVKIYDDKIEIVSPGRKTESLIKDIYKIEYNHRKGYILIKLKNGERKMEPYIRVLESQREEFENEIRRINERGAKDE